MTYDQVEAKLRFEGLLGLWKKLHDNVIDKELTLVDFTMFAEEGRHLVKAYNDEMDHYEKTFGTDDAYMPTVDIMVQIQRLVLCTASHLTTAREKIEDKMRGRAMFTEMLGKPSVSKQKVWN